MDWSEGLERTHSAVNLVTGDIQPEYGANAVTIVFESEQELRLGGPHGEDRESRPEPGLVAQGWRRLAPEVAPPGGAQMRRVVRFLFAAGLVIACIVPAFATAAGAATTPTDHIAASTITGSGVGVTSDFGTAMARSGNMLVIGAPGNDSAYVFELTRGHWRQVAILEDTNTTAALDFGFAVAISNGLIVVGAPIDDDLAGRAYVFEEKEGHWLQVAALAASGTSRLSEFGWAVAVVGGAIIVATHPLMYRARQAYVYGQSATGWKLTGELRGGADFGLSLATWGHMVAIGAAARVYLFRQTETSFRLVALLTGFAEDGAFGSSVAVGDGYVVVGAPVEAVTGRAYVFSNANGSYRMSAELAGYGVPGVLQFGSSVAVSGQYILVGAPYTESNINGGSGIAYLFVHRSKGWVGGRILWGANGAAGPVFFGTAVMLSPTTAFVSAYGGRGRVYLYAV